jgi:hypothetical protein
VKGGFVIIFNENVFPSSKASIFPFSSEQGNVKEKVQKLFQKPGGGSPFWKK